MHRTFRKKVMRELWCRLFRPEHTEGKKTTKSAQNPKRTGQPLDQWPRWLQ